MSELVLGVFEARALWSPFPVTSILDTLLRALEAPLLPLELLLVPGPPREGSPREGGWTQERGRAGAETSLSSPQSVLYSHCADM